MLFHRELTTLRSLRCYVDVGNILMKNFCSIQVFELIVELQIFRSGCKLDILHKRFSIT